VSCSRFQVASQYSGKSEGCQSREESINPDDDDRVLVYNRGLDDLLKTLVAGGGAANWSVLDAAMDFDLGDLVMDENEGDPTGHFCIGKDAGATLVEETEDEAASWDDHTGDLPVTSGITKVVVPRFI